MDDSILSHEGLYEIKLLQHSIFADITDDNSKHDKINEIAEKVNILIRLENDRINSL